MAVFKNRPAVEFKKLDGDFIYEIVGVSKTLSDSKVTRGSDKYTLKLREVRSGSYAQATLFDCASSDFCMGQIDTFCVAFGVPVKVGEEIDFSPENLIGRRGWATGFSEPDKNDASKHWNNIRRFIVNKEKLARNVPKPPVDDDSDVPF